MRETAPGRPSSGWRVVQYEGFLDAHRLALAPAGGTGPAV
jgi:hypothetical protein